jgi:ribonuclease D
LIQVSTTARLMLIDPYTVGDLTPFWEILTHPRTHVIVHAGREETRMCQFGIGKTPPNLIDVQIAAGLAGFTYPIGYGNLVLDVLGIRTDKGETLTDWRRRPLSPAQQHYAYNDVRFLLPAWKRLHAKLTKRKRMDWLKEEVSASIVKHIGEDDAAAERWRKVKGLGGLDRKALAVARAVVQWRERFAERVNRPSRYLLRDDLVVEIARRQPKSAADLATLRGLPRGEADAIAAAVRQALALPQDQWPHREEREHDTPNVALLAQLLGIVLADFCQREDLSPAIVATTSELKALARVRQDGGPLPERFALAEGWRGRAVLPELNAVLEGRRVLRVHDAKAKYPLRVEYPPGEDPRETA